MKLILLILLLWCPLGFSSLNQSERITFEGKHEKLKYFLLTGEQKKAYAVFRTSSALFQKANLFYYYQSIFSYLDKDYKEALSHIRKIRNIGSRKEKQICQIEVVSLFMTRQWRQGYFNWKICSNKYENKNYKDQYFMGSLLESMASIYNPIQPREFRKIQNDPEKIKLWIKLASFLKKSDIIEDYASSLSDLEEESSEIKDLNALINYDLKKIQVSYEIIKESESLAAYLIKANLLIFKKRYKDAHKVLESSLKDNPTSKALLKRLVLTSFILEKNEETLKYINTYQGLFKSVPLDFYWKKVLVLITMNKVKKAKLALSQYMDNLKTYGITSLLSIRKFIALQDDDKLETLFYSEKSCKLNDFSACWLKILLKSNFKNMKKMQTASNTYEQFIAKLNAGWLLPANEDSKKYSANNSLSQSEVQRLDQVERTKELFFQE